MRTMFAVGRLNARRSEILVAKASREAVVPTQQPTVSQPTAGEVRVIRYPLLTDAVH